MTEDERSCEPQPAGVRLAHEIRRLRQEAGLSQPQLARKIGYTRQYVSLAERLDHNLPSAELVRALDRALDADNHLVALREQGKREQQSLHRQGLQKKRTGQNSSHDAELPLLSGLAPADIPDLVDHLREQWHLLVKTDNLFGPRFALGSVHEHLRLLAGLARSARGAARREIVRLAAQYAESAAWLHEDAGEPSAAHHWTGRAMEWSHEADDRLMLAWTLFRRSQQATAGNDPAGTLGMAEAAHRDGPALPAPMRAAITQQQAHGHALDGDALTAQKTLDQAHAWAAADTQGEARSGHGSFCTASYIELQRAHCWLRLGQPRKAVDLYEAVLPSLPVVYRRDRGSALSRFAMASTAVGEPERAAHLADEALDIAHSSGSVRTKHELRGLAAALAPYDSVAAVADFRAKMALDAGL
ncbi:transcriptional regulator with XRE-family HTH domain [Saccharothrix coeruleofusca]|uniref:helix-turn-helix domain-containing protein n=1 Tax=Saccharothrix coeruleofusca TaxID=33919 RepID=UPI001AE12621|nr:helix-turn-helix transcriptional regulator [Saccharothrix coeruleofusca]MBP2334691.1 transcriptional regulator with XRE-family HTH domain [Saccharothrix coeruleofusca]